MKYLFFLSPLVSSLSEQGRCGPRSIRSRSTFTKPTWSNSRQGIANGEKLQKHAQRLMLPAHTQNLTIIKTADPTDVISTSRSLREKGCKPIYDFSQLLEGTAKLSEFGPIFEKIDGLIRDWLGFDKVAEHRKPMADALDLIQKHRIAGNMKFFIAELKKELGIEKLALQNPKPMTPDGLPYDAYDTEKTVDQLRKSAENEADPEKKAKIEAQADGLAANIQELVIKMRSPDYKEKVKDDVKLAKFKRHQAAIFRAKNTLKLLQKIEKGGKC
ncbi:hypothetical protein V6Z94_001927 [Aspergillus fumigatus]